MNAFEEIALSTESPYFAYTATAYFAGDDAHLKEFLSRLAGQTRI
jgi:hypothetical protein